MKVCIIGCGAIGGMYGAHLAMRDDVEVWAYDKDEKHVAAMNQNGLELVGEQGCKVKVKATLDPADIPECDLGIIATKIYHTRDAIEATAHLFRKGIVCSLQNGVGNEEIIAEYVAQVASGTTLAGGHISSPGVIKIDTKEKTWIGPFAGDLELERIQHVAELLSTTGMETLAIPDIRGMKWSKLIFNAAANPLCALTNLPFGEVYNQPQLRKMMYGIAKESIVVSNALGIDLPSNPIEMLDNASESAALHVPSMLSDVRSKRKTEIDALNGGVARFGRQVDIACPLNDAMVALVKGFEHSW